MDTNGVSEKAPVCEADRLSQLVDDQLNGGARNEFDAANSDLIEPGEAIDEGSVFLDEASMEFKTQDSDCGLCGGKAKLASDGSVEASSCAVSGMCEYLWAERYPDKYRSRNGNAPGHGLPCGAEIGCTAIVAVVGNNGSTKAKVSGGGCEIIKRGLNWKSRSEAAIKGEVLQNPDHGIPEWDGVDTDRE